MIFIHNTLLPLPGFGTNTAHCLSKNAKSWKEKNGRRIEAAILPPPFTVPTTALKCGHYGVIATIHWLKHGVAGRLSEPTMLSAPYWSSGLGILRGLRSCGREDLTVWYVA